MLPDVLAVASDPGPMARLHAAMALGALDDSEADAALADLVAREAHPCSGTAALTGLAGRELDFSGAGWTWAWKTARWSRSSRNACWRRPRLTRVAALFALFEATPEDQAWRRDALLDAFARIRYPQPSNWPKSPPR